MAVGVDPGDQVITNGFTFTALPSTIMRLGAEPVLVEATKSWTMDLDDLEKKIAAFPDAYFILTTRELGARGPGRRRTSRRASCHARAAPAQRRAVGRRFERTPAALMLSYHGHPLRPSAGPLAPPRPTLSSPLQIINCNFPQQTEKPKRT